jgi:hypothetical protein
MKDIIIKINNSRLIWTVGTFVLLFLSFFICRYASWEIHLNREWSMVMFITSLVALGVAVIFNGRKVMICTIIG